MSLYLCTVSVTGILCSHNFFRDELRAQLDQKQSPTSQVALDVDITDASQFRFRSKTIATVATNNQLSSVNNNDFGRIPNGSMAPTQGRPHLTTDEQTIFAHP